MSWGDNLNNAPREKIFSLKVGENPVRIVAGDAGFGDRKRSHFVDKKYYTCFGEKDGCPFHGDNAPVNQKGEPIKPSTQVGFYIIDKTDDSIKFALFPWSVANKVIELASSRDYGFESMPMPYDITIIKKEHGKCAPGDMYSILPSPTKTIVPSEVMDKVAALEPIAKRVASLISFAKNKSLSNVGGGTPVVSESEEPDLDDDIKPDEIPF